MKDVSLCTLSLLFTLCMTSMQAQNVSYYISDAGNFNQPPWQILKFDEQGQNGQVFISQHLDWPQDILFFEESNTVLVSNLNSGKISRFNATTGAYIDEFATGIQGPTRMKIGKDSLLYVLQWSGTGKVLRFALDGTAMGPFTATGVGTSIGIDWDSAGNLYVSSYNGKIVRKYDSTGSDKGNFISGLAGPTNIWFDAGGDLFVNDYNAGIVKQYANDGSFKANLITNVAQCEGVQVLPDGKIVLGVGATSSVRIYNANGSFSGDLVAPGTLNLLTPNAVVRREPSVSTGTEPIRYQERQLVTPSIGTIFFLSESERLMHNGFADIMNSTGAVTGKINLAESYTWDATSFPDGIYFLTYSIGDNTLARQKIMVQH
ncbi:MAG: hypothetical protein H7X99_02665 [Saprospiraceae bacterium]|nr:hypothetical protein [Saprospiraceae bacterium]